MISRRARCALHAVGFLAAQPSEMPVVLADIRRYLRTYSKQLTFSAGHISKILNPLCREGILRAVPGRNGGYLLARAPSEVRLVEIVQALDGGSDEHCCLLSIGACENQPSCGVFHVVREAELHFYQFLARETVESLTEKMFHGRPPPLAPEGSAPR